jgi:hypothetical protein
MYIKIVRKMLVPFSAYTSSLPIAGCLILLDARPSIRPAKRAALFDRRGGSVTFHRGARELLTSGKWMEISSEWIVLPRKKLEECRAAV